MMARVSIVLPTWNRLPLLKIAVQSVLAQTCTHWELVVVDDGSTDGTGEWIKSLADPRIRLIARERTGNVARLRNIGVAAGRSEYVAFLDSDDVWLPGKLEAQLAALAGSREKAAAGNSMPAWSYTHYEHIDLEGRPIASKPVVWGGRSGRITRELLTSEIAATIVSVMASRALLEHIGGFDERHSSREDFDLVVRLSLAADAVALSECLVQVRHHAGRTTALTDLAQLHEAAVRVHESLRSLLPDADLRRVAQRRMAHHLAEAAAANFRSRRYRASLGQFWRSAAQGHPPRRWGSAVVRALLPSAAERLRRTRHPRP